MMQRLNHKGSILILCLWTLMFLTVLAVQIGLIIRQRVSLLSRIETREHLRDAASSGVQKAIAALRLDLFRNGGLYTNYGKTYRHNNREIFKGISLGGSLVDVVYDYTPVAGMGDNRRYGVVDAESKININTADYGTLQRLFGRVLGLNAERAQHLALAVIDWREFGESLPDGFNSDNYYGNLEFPYEAKNAEFEIIDELGLIEGVTPDILTNLKPFVTVYGDGLININTASKEVLLAIGLQEEAVNKLIQVRQGLDEEEATTDDYIFYKTFDIATEIKAFLELADAEIKQIDALNLSGKIKTNSAFFEIESRATLKGRKGELLVACVYNARDGEIEYWREK